MNAGIACFGHGLGAKGGVQVYLRELLAALARARASDERYTLLVGPDEPEPPEASAPGFELVRIADRGFASSSLAGRLARLAGGCAEIERLGLALVHYPATRLLHPLRRTPVVLTFFDMQEEFLPFFGWRARWARRVLHRFSVRRARVVIAPSEFTARCLRERYGTPSAKLACVPPGIGEEFFAPSPAGEAGLLPGLGLVPDGYAFYPANPWPHKNHERLLRAWAALDVPGEPPPVLVCSGRVRGETRSVAELARRSGLAPERVRDLGFVSSEQLPALVRGARLLVFPSLFEGAGLPVAEALAAGCPVACADLPPLREIADGAAVFFDPLSESGLGRAVAELWADETLRARLASLGRARAEARRWNALVPALKAVYRRAAIAR